MPASPTVNEQRLKDIEQISLERGAHQPDHTFCVMEAVAFVAGEKWGDSPQCSCPVISAFLRSWNDSLPNNAERDRLLKPLIPSLIGTRASKEIETRRSLMAADWLVRVHTPAWLRLAGLNSQADSLSSLPEITSMAQVPSIQGPLEAVRKDAYAAWDAAWDAARAAAGAAARAAAGAKLQPTVDELQQPALELVKRMIAVTEKAGRA